MYQVGGSHYANKSIEPIEFIEKNSLPFSYGNIIKYLTRWKEKGGVQDLRKARQYMDFIDKYDVTVSPTTHFMGDLKSYVEANKLADGVLDIFQDVYKAIGLIDITHSFDRNYYLTRAKEKLDEMVDMNINYEVGVEVKPKFEEQVLNNVEQCIDSCLINECKEDAVKLLNRELTQFLKLELECTPFANYEFAHELCELAVPHIVGSKSLDGYFMCMSSSLLPFGRYPVNGYVDMAAFSSAHEEEIKDCIEKNIHKNKIELNKSLYSDVSITYLSTKMVGEALASSFLYTPLDELFRDQISVVIEGLPINNLLALKEVTNLNVVKEEADSEIDYLQKHPSQTNKWNEQRVEIANQKKINPPTAKDMATKTKQVAKRR